MVMMKTAWDLDDSSFMLVLAVALDLAPFLMSSIISSGDLTAKEETPEIKIPFLASSLMVSFYFSCLRRSVKI